MRLDLNLLGRKTLRSKLKNLLGENLELSKKVDIFSRFTFPSLFLLFLLFYYLNYVFFALHAWIHRLTFQWHSNGRNWIHIYIMYIIYHHGILFPSVLCSTNKKVSVSSLPFQRHLQEEQLSPGICWLISLEIANTEKIELALTAFGEKTRSETKE